MTTSSTNGSFETVLHGVRLSVECDGSDAARHAARELELDFAAWERTDGDLAESSSRPTPTVRLKLAGFPGETHGQVPRLPAFRTRMGQAHGWGSRRLVRYDDRSTALLDARARDAILAEVNSPDADLLREISYSAALALVGELLDTRRLHRAHALGISVRGRNALFLLDEKAGKSTLAMALRLHAAGQARFFSDETPLLRDDHIFAYPTRLALRESSVRLFETSGTGDTSALGEHRVFRRRTWPQKRLYAWRPDELADSGRVDVIVLDGGRGHARARFVPAPSAAAAVELARSLVVGVGVAQMAEFILRLNARHVARLASIGASRVRTAIALTSASRAFTFERTDDPRANVEAVLEGFAKLAT